jgi:hypothetical protein
MGIRAEVSVEGPALLKDDDQVLDRGRGQPLVGADVSPQAFRRRRPPKPARGERTGRDAQRDENGAGDRRHSAAALPAVIGEPELREPELREPELREPSCARPNRARPNRAVAGARRHPRLVPLA